MLTEIFQVGANNCGPLVVRICERSSRLRPFVGVIRSFLIIVSKDVECRGRRSISADEIFVVVGRRVDSWCVVDREDKSASFRRRLELVKRRLSRRCLSCSYCFSSDAFSVLNWYKHDSNDETSCGIVCWRRKSLDDCHSCSRNSSRVSGGNERWVCDTVVAVDDDNDWVKGRRG